MKHKKKRRNKKITEKKELNERLSKNKIIGDIRTRFKHEEDYYKLKIVNSFWNNI